MYEQEETAGRSSDKELDGEWLMPLAVRDDVHLSDVFRDSKPVKTDVQKFMEILAKRKVFILVFFLSATLTSLGLTYIVSERYQAAITILYHPAEASLLKLRERESFGAPVPFAPFSVISQTLRDAVRNNAVLQPVVEKLHLDQKIEVEYSTWYKRWYHKTKGFVKVLLGDAWQLLKHGRLIEEDPKIAAIRSLRENINIATTSDSYIHILIVKDKFPARAAKIVDLAGREMVKWLNMPVGRSDILSYDEQRIYMRSQSFDVPGWQGHVVCAPQVEDGFQANVAIQVAVQVDERQVWVYHVGPPFVH